MAIFSTYLRMLIELKQRYWTSFHFKLKPFTRTIRDWHKCLKFSHILNFQTIKELSNLYIGITTTVEPLDIYLELAAYLELKPISGGFTNTFSGIFYWLVISDPRCHSRTFLCFPAWLFEIYATLGKFIYKCANMSFVINYMWFISEIYNIWFVFLTKYNSYTNCLSTHMAKSLFDIKHMRTETLDFLQIAEKIVI